MQQNPYLMLAVGAAVGVSATAFYLTRDAATNYHECMVHEMRGQDWAIHDAVTKVCQRRWKEPYEMASGTQLQWIRNSAGGVSVTPQENFPADHQLMSASVSFATVDCDAAKKMDFRHHFDDQIAHFGVIGIVWTDPMPPLCMRTFSVKARYR